MILLNMSLVIMAQDPSITLVPHGTKITGVSRYFFKIYLFFFLPKSSQIYLAAILPFYFPLSCVTWVAIIVDRNFLNSLDLTYKRR